jgi:hypothetical protein
MIIGVFVIERVPYFHIKRTENKMRLFKAIFSASKLLSFLISDSLSTGRKGINYAPGGEKTK